MIFVEGAAGGLDQISGEKKTSPSEARFAATSCSQQMVKDHRTKEQVGDVNRVFDGDLIRSSGLPDEEGLRHADRPPPGRRVIFVAPLRLQRHLDSGFGIV
jgi:hypothetical protein